VIDLHLHTTASDGSSSPVDLVGEAHAAGITTMAVTDHDTTAGIAAASAEAVKRGVTFVTGIEITAVVNGRDVHVLGYFFDANHAGLLEFLARQRDVRRRRVLEIGKRLEALGVPVPLDDILATVSTESGRAVGRPLIAAAMVGAGHAHDIADAFDRFLGQGQPAYVERMGAPPAEVIGLISRAGGVASLAHPAKARMDSEIDAFVADGLRALEVYHPDHDARDVERYRTFARDRQLLVTGGSDYHGLGSGRTSGFGRVRLPADDFDRLRSAASVR